MATKEFQRKRERFGVVYGLAGGLFFSLLFWGVDAIGLAGAHVNLPFTMFLAGAFVCCSAGALLGWLCVKIDRAVISILLWILAAFALVNFVLWLRFAGYQQIMLLLRPDLAGMINYRQPDNFNQYLTLSMIVVGILALICGALENMLVESAMGQSGLGGIILMLLLCSLLMSFSGNILGSVVNDDFRNSAKALDGAIHQAMNTGVTGVNQEGKRSIVRDILALGENVYSQPHRLTMLKYDPFMFVEIRYLVEFGTTQMDCTTIVKKAISCKPYVGN